MPRKKIQDQNDPMAILAKIALDEQAAKIAENNNKKLSREQALRQMHQTERDKATRDARLQSICDHLLGNHRTGVKPRDPKSALHYDQLSNACVRIYCGKCRFEWLPGDKDDHIIRMCDADPTRPPARFPNPTKTSWLKIREFFFSFDNANDLISRAFRLERMEPETAEQEESRLLEAMGREQQIPAA